MRLQTTRKKQQLRRHQIAYNKRMRLAKVSYDTNYIILDSKTYTSSDSSAVHDLARDVSASRSNPIFYPHNSGLLSGWSTSKPLLHCATEGGTSVEFAQCSSLMAARSFSRSIATDSSTSPSTIGILNSASPKRPGGRGFLTGGRDDLENRILRGSTLFASLSSGPATEFYRSHRQDTASGLYNHAMLYSPGILAIRDDRGQLLDPLEVNIVSCSPANAAAFRFRFINTISRDEIEQGIADTMHERMARILRLFEERGDRVLVLPAFGSAGSAEGNDLEIVAAIWADLLVGPKARFKNVFDKIIFSIPNIKYFRQFREAFFAKTLEAELTTDES